MEFIDLKQSYNKYKESIDLRIRKVLDNGTYIMGPEIVELETSLKEYVRVKHCISVASGTDSLEIALRAFNIGMGDEVITVPFSWISTAEVIVQVGATPVFVDIEPDYYSLNHNLLEKAITKKTKAIMPVSLFGQMPNLEEIMRIAEKYNIPVIEDAAQSFGATRHGKKSCGVCVISSTSFFPAKPLGCFGDGGALFTDDDEIANNIRAIRNHGGLVRHNHTHIGMNGRMDTIQAAVILGKWHGFEEEVEARIKIGARYSEALKSFVDVPKILDGNTHVYAQYTVRVESGKREFVIDFLKNRGIPTGVYYPKCFHEQPAFAFLKYNLGDFPESEKASNEVLSLPMHPYLNVQEQDYIIESLIESLK
jgi:UDP-2-acetamido-2-deoxy-ribo-hexuluronate aminotransferase